MDLAEVVIVLSRPEESGNIGAVCRAMMNMGLSRLRVVLGHGAAADGAKPDEAVIRARAVHAAGIWEKAEFFPTLEAALAGCSPVVGVTRRTGRHRKAHSLTPAETAAFLAERPGPAALVFGNERTGLEDSELKLCNMAAHIPAAGAFPSLNLSHAVQIFCYELRLKLADGSGAGISRWVPLEMAQIDALVQSVTDSLQSLGFYKQPGRAEQERFFRDLFARAGITRRESEYLAEIFSKAARLRLRGALRDSEEGGG
ncbi:MAG: RNA methyltransferase [Treponema sp.]|jgi:tRNA/rRNA methyltransferase/tRNA (cytidine32/uridine32-2'-O)-methyltransferase|nr:RNA methyltransferase [Treponema sp.]